MISTDSSTESTGVLRVRIANASAKTRTGLPHDDRVDMVDTDLQKRVWTGIVPVYQTFGTPVPGPYNQVEKVPDYIADYLKETNEDRKTYASVDALKEPVKLKKEND